MLSPYQTGIPKSKSESEERLATEGTYGIIGASLLVLVALVLISGDSYDLFHGNFSAWATYTEKFWTFVSSATTLLGVVIGLWFAWIKFFRTRAGEAKVELTPTAGRVTLPNHGGNLHWLNVKLENRGPKAIKDYEIAVSSIFHGQSGQDTAGRDMQNVETRDAHTTYVIDIGAATDEHFILKVAEHEAQAITFCVKVTDKEQNMWRSHVTVSNLPAKEPDPQQRRATASMDA